MSDLEIYRTLMKGVKPGWRKLIECTPTLHALLISAMDKLIETCDESRITPSICNIMQWAKYSDINQVKIVILGQDPYPAKGDANGLAFSTGASKCPKSLSVIYRCLKQTGCVSEIPNIFTLTNWAKQGVLLLNTALTTEIGARGKTRHFLLWKEFVDNIIKCVASIDNEIIWMLWGSHAQSKCKLITGRHIIYKTAHPSPLAQNRITNPTQQFINCTHFIDANDVLEEEKQQPIIWDPVIHHVVYTDGSANLRLGKLKKAHKGSIAGWAYYITKGPLKQLQDSGLVKTREKIRIAVKDSDGNIVPTLYTGYPTSIRAEGIAIIKALAAIVNHKPRYEGIITLKTDCKFWYDVIMTYKWMDTSKKIDDKKNRDIINKLRELHTKIVNEIGELEIVHIKASHNIASEPDEGDEPAYSDYHANDLVDKMAKKIVCDAITMMNE